MNSIFLGSVILSGFSWMPGDTWHHGVVDSHTAVFHYLSSHLVIGLEEQGQRYILFPEEPNVLSRNYQKTVNVPPALSLDADQARTTTSNTLWVTSLMSNNE